MEAKRQCISDLLHAVVDIATITSIMECSPSLVYKVRSMIKNGESLARKPGSGGNNKIHSDEFLMGLASEVEADGTKGAQDRHGGVPGRAAERGQAVG